MKISMKIQDALNTLAISETPVTLEMVKEAYRAAAKKYHPDIYPASEETMKIVNGAYGSLCETQFPISNTFETDASDYGSELNHALNKIIIYLDLQIEICGSWVWVSGNTKERKDILKEAGFRYSGPKKMWCFRPNSDRKKYRGTRSIDDIRNVYGSKRVKTATRHRLTTT